MTGAELLAEGRQLARPCTFLKTRGDTYAGVWRGKAPFPKTEPNLDHWISVDRSILPGQSEAIGYLSVHVAADARRLWVAGQWPFELPRATDGVKLYAHPGVSLPPIDAVFKFGSPDVGDWLCSNQWEREWGYNDNFKDRKPVDEYEKIFQKESPLYSGEAHAVVGGWHMVWPDGDWDRLLERTLILTTYADSEPWVEVWQAPGGVEVIPRIT